MNSSDITKSMLEGLAKTFNDNIVAKSDPLPDGSKSRVEIIGADGKKTKVRVTKDIIFLEIKNAAEALLQEGDKDIFSAGEIELMKAMGIDVDALLGTESESEDVKCECANEPANEPAKEEVGEEKPAKKTAKKNKKVKKEEPVKENVEQKKEIKDKPKKKSVKKEVDHSLSNKARVYGLWSNGNQDVSKLYELVSKAVKEGTIKGWISSWNKGKNLPAIAKEK